MLIFHTEHNILMALLGEKESSAGDHIRNGYPELLEDWEAGRIRATELDEIIPINCLIMDSGKPRQMTEDEARAKDAILAAEASATAAAVELEAKISAELRTMALERIEAKEQVIKEV